MKSRAQKIPGFTDCFQGTTKLTLVQDVLHEAIRPDSVQRTGPFLRRIAI
jgi:hypothetical protein